MKREIEAGLLESMAAMPVIDAHEHLPPEKQRTGSHVDFSTLFSHYTQTDLKSAGMSPEDYERFQAPETDLDEKWRLFAPYWERIRFMSYARPALIAAREFYGCEGISEGTYRALSERMQAGNTPGLYRRVLRDKGNIRVALTQIGAIPDADRDLLIPLLPVDLWSAVADAETMAARGAAHGVTVRTLEDYLAAMRAGLEQWRAQGVVGIKARSLAMTDPTQEEARAAFDALMAGGGKDFTALGHYLHHEVLDLAGELGLVVAVHCGIIWDNWNDFYTLHPRHMVPVLLKHRNTRFDLYHAGLPWVRDTGVIGKDFPNANLNLCWCHIISPRMTASFLDEWIDLVPINKIMGFGGDYGRPVEKVYGHLVMAREVIARVLAGRIADHLITEGEALRIAERLLYHNPRELYGLDA